MAAEEEGVVSGQRDVPIGPLKTVVVPFDITILRDGLYAVPFIEEVVRCPVHLALGRILIQIVPYIFEFGLQCRKYRWCILLTPFQVVINSPSVFPYPVLMLVMIK